MGLKEKRVYDDMTYMLTSPRCPLSTTFRQASFVSLCAGLSLQSMRYAEMEHAKHWISWGYLAKGSQHHISEGCKYLQMGGSFHGSMAI